MGGAGGVVKRGEVGAHDDFVAAALAAGKFQVLDDGTIINTNWRNTGAPRKVALFGRKYLSFNMTFGAEMWCIYAHRMIAIAKHGMPPGPFMEVDHLDGNKFNNHPSNLQWVKRSENQRRAYALGLKAPSAIIGREGTSNHMARLSEDQVRLIHRDGIRGVSKSQLAKTYGVTAHAIGNILKGARWKHIYAEFNP